MIAPTGGQSASLLRGIVPDPESPLAKALHEFKQSRNMSGKGQIAAMIYASRLARECGLPFDTVNGIHTEGQGQVKGLGKAAVQKVLSDYGISKVLATEGGRTSRGSLGNIISFLNYLNAMHATDPVDVATVEAWWVRQAEAFFNAKPFQLRLEVGKSLHAVIMDLLEQAKSRQEHSAGTKYVGAMLQHLIGAKLSLALPKEDIKHYGFSVADAPVSRSGDFEVGDASIHVTTAPGSAVAMRCVENLDAGRRPIILTVYEMLAIAAFQANEVGIGDSVDILDATQFIVGNLHESASFREDERRAKVEALIQRYNSIVEAHETDPSLKISLV